MAGLEGFNRRTRWFLDNREDLAKQITFMEEREHNGAAYLLALPKEERAKRVLKYVFDENEFLSDYGIRSLSKYHLNNPFTMHISGEDMSVQYVPGESNTSMFGGNSNWRGPIWFPMNFLLIEALERYHNFYGKNMIGEFPTGSGDVKDLSEVAYDLNTRLVSMFLPDKEGRRPCHGEDKKFAEDPHWKNLVLFYEVGIDLQRCRWLKVYSTSMETLGRVWERTTRLGGPLWLLCVWMILAERDSDNRSKMPTMMKS